MPIIAKKRRAFACKQERNETVWPKTAVLCGFRPVIRFDKMPVKVYNTGSNTVKIRFIFERMDMIWQQKGSGISDR